MKTNKKGRISELFMGILGTILLMLVVLQFIGNNASDSISNDFDQNKMTSIDKSDQGINFFDYLDMFWQLMTFQLDGVPWYISLVVDTMIGLGLVFIASLIIRGV